MPDLHDEILRRLTPEEKLAVAHQLRETAWELTAAGIRLRHPELSEDAVQARVRTVGDRLDSNVILDEVRRLGLEAEWEAVERSGE